MGIIQIKAAGKDSRVLFVALVVLLNIHFAVASANPTSVPADLLALSYCTAQIKEELRSQDHHLPRSKWDFVAEVFDAHALARTGTGMTEQHVPEFIVGYQDEHLRFFKVKRLWSNGTRALSITLKISDRGSELPLQQRLHLEVSSKLVEPEQYQVIERTFRINARNHCQIAEVEANYLDAIFPVSDQRRTTLRKTWNAINDIETHVPRSFVSNLPLCEALFFDSDFLPLTNGESVDCFSVEIFQTSTVKHVSSHSYIEQNKEFKEYVATVSIGPTLLFELNATYSRVEEDAIIRLKIVNGPILATRHISATEWDAMIFPALGSPEALNTESYPHNLPLLDGLDYCIVSPTELSPDSLNSYFNMTLYGSSNGRRVYLVAMDRKGRTEYFQGFESRYFPSVSATEYLKFLVETSWIDFSHPRVQALVARVRERMPHLPPTQGEFVEAILSEISGRFAFDQNMSLENAVQPLPASEALKRPMGVCQHFAVIFVAICRALGVPARVVLGARQVSAGITKLNHGWVEILVDGQRWLPLEPQSSTLQDALIIQHYIPMGSVENILSFDEQFRVLSFSMGAQIHIALWPRCAN